MWKKKKSEDGVCASTPSLSWRPLHGLSQNSNSNVSARKLAAHLYRNTFQQSTTSGTCISSDEVASCSLSDTASYTYDLNQLHVRKDCKSRYESLVTIQSLMKDIDDEQRHRKRLESLNHKLVQELNDANLLISSTLKEVQKERHSCTTVKDLCDKFAKAILYSQSEVKELKLTCRMAEAWLERRTLTCSKTIRDLSLSPEERSFYRRSSESFLLNMPHEDNSTENDLYCFDQQKSTTSTKRRTERHWN